MKPKPFVAIMLSYIITGANKYGSGDNVYSGQRKYNMKPLETLIVPRVITCNSQIALPVVFTEKIIKVTITQWSRYRHPLSEPSTYNNYFYITRGNQTLD